MSQPILDGLPMLFHGGAPGFKPGGSTTSPAAAPLARRNVEGVVSNPLMLRSSDGTFMKHGKPEDMVARIKTWLDNNQPRLTQKAASYSVPGPGLTFSCSIEYDDE